MRRTIVGYLYINTQFSDYHYWNFDSQGTEDWNGRNALNQGIWTPPWDPTKHYWQIGDSSFITDEKRGIVSPTLNAIHTDKYNAIEIKFIITGEEFAEDVETYFWIDDIRLPYGPEPVKWVSGPKTEGSENTYRGIIKYTGQIQQVRIDIAKGCLDTENCKIFINEVRFLEISQDFYLLSGTVSDTSGNPLQGWVYANETSGANLGNQVYTSDGTYEMALFPGNYDVYAQTYTYEPQGGYTQIKTQLQNITMRQDATVNIVAPSYEFYHLTGRVTDTNGTGQPNVSVQAWDPTWTCYSNTTTAADGSYDTALIAGTYTLEFTPSAGSRLAKEKICGIQVEGDVTQDISLSEQYILTGTLSDSSGNPMQGWIYANETGGANPGNSVYSSDGTYQMPLFQGTYRVHARAYSSYQTSHTYITTPYQTLTMTSDSSSSIVVPSHDFYHLSGKVTDVNDVVQPSVSIQAYDSSGISYGYTGTGSNGNYDLLLIPGTYRLRISAPPATYPPFEIKKVIIYGDRVRNIRLSLDYTLLEQAMAQLLPDLALALDVFEIIDQAQTLNYDISVQGAKDLLQIVLNWQGSEMKVTLYEPDGGVYGEYQSADPPINIEIPDPAEGTWQCQVTAVDVPHDNYPFALVVGISPNQSPVADANGPYSGAVGSPITFDASGSYDPDGEIVLYEWDWDADGTHDESTNSASINHTWAEPYSGNVGLRVTDAEGATHADTTFVESLSGVLTICSFLGNNPSPRLPDQDIFKFHGAKGETVIIRLEAEPPESGLGKRTFFGFWTPRPGLTALTLPCEITKTLPKSGVYYVAVGSNHRKGRILPWEKYAGDYCITLEASPETCQTLEPALSVE